MFVGNLLQDLRLGQIGTRCEGEVDWAVNETVYTTARILKMSVFGVDKRVSPYLLLKQVDLQLRRQISVIGFQRGNHLIMHLVPDLGVFEIVH